MLSMTWVISLMRCDDSWMTRMVLPTSSDRHSAAVGNDLRLGREPASLLRRVGRLPHRANAATGEFGDMIAMGILDPTKVTRSALQNAASIAGLMITTEAMVAELPKKEAPAHDHGGGGMGGMGGMDF
jgi:hypothetical protein